MKHSCSFCKLEFEKAETLAGHRSAHVRRGEIPKRTRRTEFKCEICECLFATGSQLAGHNTKHRIPFESLKKDGSRKDRLLEELGHKCQICELAEWMGKPIPIEIDHIDGNPENTKRENFRLVCPNCHAQTPTYRGRNVGKVKNSKRASVLRKYRYKYR